MTLNGALAPAFDALDDSEAALRKLDASCCEQGRSPRMKALADILAEARAGFVRVGDDAGAADAALAHLEDAGSQVGSLQVGCCAPNRMPLYNRLLGDLTTAQITLNRALGSHH